MQTPDEITLDTFRAKLKELVERRPVEVNPVYSLPVQAGGADNSAPPGCRLAFDGEPSCVVGNTLPLLGFDAEAIVRISSQEDMGVRSFDALMQDLQVSVTGEMTGYLGVVQSEADGGKDWEDAVKVAEDLYEQYGPGVFLYFEESAVQYFEFDVLDFQDWKKRQPAYN